MNFASYIEKLPEITLKYFCESEDSPGVDLEIKTAVANPTEFCKQPILEWPNDWMTSSKKQEPMATEKKPSLEPTSGGSL